MKYFQSINLLSILLLVVCFTSACNKDKRTQDEIDREIIIQYIEQENLNVTEHASGLFYEIIQEGNGEHPSPQANVTVRYKGYLTSGNVFDETTGTQTQKFDLPDLIEGWKIGIPLLSKGGKGIFIIPSSLGYGDMSLQNIPRNSVLVFEIQLVNFVD
jgi:FKBP-type peptidyl-prolyl cis-trans isomerase FkpA